MYPCRDTVTSLQCPFIYFISEIDCGLKFRLVNDIRTCPLLGLRTCLLSTGRYYLYCRLRSTSGLIYISLSDPNRRFRYAIMLLISLYLQQMNFVPTSTGNETTASTETNCM